MTAMKEAADGADKLWNGVLDTIDRQGSVDAALMRNLRMLASSLVAVKDLAESRGQALRGIRGTSDAEVQALLEDDLEILDLLANRALEALSSSHVREIDVELGDPYDPSTHEPVSIYGSSYPDGSVCRVLEKGYVYHDECDTRFIVRSVRVDVSSGSVSQIA